MVWTSAKYNLVFSHLYIIYFLIILSDFSICLFDLSIFILLCLFIFVTFQDGLKTCYKVTKEHPTGTCAVLVEDKERWVSFWCFCLSR